MEHQEWRVQYMREGMDGYADFLCEEDAKRFAAWGGDVGALIDPVLLEITKGKEKEVPYVRNMYYSNSSSFDLSKMRADAARLARGDQFNKPTNVNIHFHAHGALCKGHRHEQMEAQHADSQ